MKQKDIVNQYVELLTAKKNTLLHLNDKAKAQQYKQLNSFCQDVLLKEKVPRNKLARMEKKGKEQFEQYEKEQDEKTHNINKLIRQMYMVS